MFLYFGLSAQLRVSPEEDMALAKASWVNCCVLPSAMTMFPALR